MGTRVYVSLNHEDEAQRKWFELLAKQSRHELHTFERAELLVRDRTGRPLRTAPTDPRAEPLRMALRERLMKSERMVVLIARDTGVNEWVDWEIRTFFELKQQEAGSTAWRRLRGMRGKGHRVTRGGDPDALAGRATVTMDWSPASLERWLETAL